MKHLFLIALMLIGLCTASAAERIVIVDAGDRGPIVGASVMSRSGVIVGLTDVNGGIRGLKRSDFPIEIHSLGYEPQVLTETTDTIALIPAVYPLSEVSVSPDRPITRVLSYARVFTTFFIGSDTLKLYMTQMLESFYADGKVKGYKQRYFSRPKGVRLYANFTNKNGLDSVARFGKNEDDFVFWELAILGSFLVDEMPCIVVEEPQSMRDGEETVSVNGRFGRETIYRKNGEIFTYYTDFLKNKKNHVSSPFLMKAMGCTMDFKEQTAQLSYRVNESGKYCVEDLIYGSCASEMIARGKVYKYLARTKEPIIARTYAEVYPVEFTYHTVGEYKELKKDSKSKIDFKLPEYLPPLPSAIAALVERIESAEPKK